MALSRSLFLLAIAMCCSQVLAQYQPKCQSIFAYIMNVDNSFGNWGYDVIDGGLATTANFSFIDVGNPTAVHYTIDDYYPSMVPFSVDALNSIHEDIPSRYLSGVRIVLFVSIALNSMTSWDTQGAIVAAANRLKEADNVEIFIMDYQHSQQDYPPQPLKFAQDVASNTYEDHVIFGNANVWYPYTFADAFGVKSFSYATVGDPYVMTMDGNFYSFNGLGEFVLYRANDYIVQVRMAPCDNSNPSSRTCNRAIAVFSQNYDATIEFHYDPVAQYLTVYLDGYILDTLVQDYYSNGVSFGWWNDFYFYIEKYDTPIDTNNVFLLTLETYTGYIQVAFGMKVGLAVMGTVDLSSFGTVQGLVGTWDGCADNDYYSQNQTYTSPSSSPRDIYFNFADTWRVNEADSLFTHGVNAQYYMPHYDEYPPEWNPAFSGVQPSANAPGDCSFFQDIAPFLYAACVDDVSKGNGDIRPIAYMMVSMACSSYCDNGYMYYDVVSEAYCASTCPEQNDLDFFANYNSTFLPPVSLTTTLVGATFSATLGGTYTYSLASEFCPDAAITGTVQITCDQPPQVNAGDDRVVKKDSTYSWPAVVLMGTANDQNNDGLEYLWEFVSAPVMPNYTAPGSWPAYLPGPGFVPDLYLAQSLTPYFYPSYPGDYVIELSVFDGCFIAKDQVTIHAECAGCELHLEASELGDIVYESAGSSNTWASVGPSASQTFVFNYEFEDNLDFHWFIDSNSRGYNFTYPVPSGSDTYTFFTTPAEVLVSSNTSAVETISSSTINSNGPVNTLTIIRNEATGVFTTVTVTDTTVTTTVDQYSSVPLPITECVIRINNAGSNQASFTVLSDRDANVSRPFNQMPACVGDYTVRAAARDECQTAYDTVNLHLRCSEQPQAHLISCTKTVKYNYPTHTFPQVSLDGSDTFDADTSTLLFQWEYVTPSGVTGYFGNANGCSGSPDYLTHAYQNCYQPHFTPAAGAGTYSITMWVSDGCTYDFESTSIVAECDSLTVSVSAPTTVTQDIDSPAYGVANFTAFFTSPNTPYVLSNQWTLQAAPVGYNSLPNAPTATATANGTINVFLAGDYTYQYSAFDGCTTASQNITFTYACSSALTVGLSASPTSLNYDTVTGFLSSTITADFTAVNTGSSRTQFKAQLIGRPLGSTTTIANNNVWQLYSGTNPTITLAPDVAGDYIVQFTAWDNCNLVVQNITVPATCSVTAPAITVTQSTWDIPSLGSVLVTGVSVPASYDTYTLDWSVIDSSNNTVDSTSGYGLTDVTFFLDTAGTYSVQVTAWAGFVCSATSSSVTVTAQCNFTLGIDAPSQATTSAFVRGKFSRVTLSPSFTGVDPYFDPMSTYLTEYQWKFIAAPEGSVFAPTTSSTTSLTGNSTTDSDYVYNGYNWTRTWVETIQYTTVTHTKYVTLVYDDTFDTYDGCFAPDIAGTYTLEFSIVDYCGTTVTQQYTVTASCNTPPTADAGSDATFTFNGTGFASSGGYMYTSIPLVGTASDADNDFLDYQWTVISQPNTSVGIISITNPRSRMASFVPTVVGDYVLQFSVTDGCSIINSTVTITVACPNTYQVNAPISFTFDGFTPVALQEFSLVANPQCTRLLTWAVTNYDPSTAIGPNIVTTTTEAPKSGSSQIAIPAFLVAFLALFVKMM